MNKVHNIKKLGNGKWEIEFVTPPNPDFDAIIAKHFEPSDCAIIDGKLQVNNYPTYKSLFAKNIISK